MRFLHKLIVTAFGLGYSPIAPGTVGALGGCVSAILLWKYTAYPNVLLAFLILLFLFFGIYCSTKMEQEWGKDPSKIVIDEVVGMWISLWLIPSGWEYFVLAFVLFRLFDIYKPFFIKKVELLKGGWGVMMDDVLAGIYTNVVIQLANAILISTKGN
jgi:phosphatidylglycerophosphatase A